MSAADATPCSAAMRPARRTSARGADRRPRRRRLRLRRDQIGEGAGAELSPRAAERLVRFARRQRESLLKLAVREQGMALSDDRGAVEHVAVAIRRPAVSNVVGAGEQRHAARAELADGGTGADGGHEVMIATSARASASAVSANKSGPMDPSANAWLTATRPCMPAAIVRSAMSRNSAAPVLPLSWR